MRVTIKALQDMKRRGEKISMITAYDYTTAKIAENAGIPVILVGDTLGQVVLGYDSTIPVTMDNMIYHVKSVVRGTSNAHIVGDLPFLSYQADVAEAIRNAGSILKYGGAQSVKLEGGTHLADTIRSIVNSGIPVMGHIGLTPQAVNQLSGYRVQGKSVEDAYRLVEDAQAIEKAGAYAIVLEAVPAALAELIVERVSVPVIGIGAGVHCDGQIQVFHDLLGLFTDFVPKHTRQYANLADIATASITSYVEDVKQEHFPAREESFTIKTSVLEEIVLRLSK